MEFAASDIMKTTFALLFAFPFLHPGAAEITARLTPTPAAGNGDYLLPAIGGAYISLLAK
jgi:hypothetical protein